MGEGVRGLLSLIQNVEIRVVEIQKGDEAERESFIHEFTSIILKEASKVCKRQIHLDSEEYLIGLHAFNEAINRFDPSKGVPFIAWYKQVLDSRLKDYFKRERKHVSALFSKEEEQNFFWNQKSLENYQEEQIKKKRREEIEVFAELLKPYDLELIDVSRKAPKHSDTREQCMRTARKIVDCDLHEAFLHETIPLRKIAKAVGVRTQYLKRHHTYILANVILHLEDLPLIKEYIHLN